MFRLEINVVHMVQFVSFDGSNSSPCPSKHDDYQLVDMILGRIQN